MDFAQSFDPLEAGASLAVLDGEARWAWMGSDLRPSALTSYAFWPIRAYVLEPLFSHWLFSAFSVLDRLQSFPVHAGPRFSHDSRTVQVKRSGHARALLP